MARNQQPGDDLGSHDASQPDVTPAGPASTGTPVKHGAIVGVLAYLVGYVAFYATRGPIGVPDVAPWQEVGWQFYRAHSVEIAIDHGYETSLSMAQVDRIGMQLGLNAPQVAVQPLPLVVLAVAGFAVARWGTKSSHPVDGAKAGAMIVAGYLPLAVAGAILFPVTTAALTIEVDPVQSLLFAGIAYPLVGGALGGLVAGLVGSTSTATAAG